MLQLYVSDVYLSLLRLGEIEVLGSEAQAGALRRRAVNLEHVSALIAWAPNRFTEDETLRQEWRTVAEEVLGEADQRPP